MQFLAFYHYLLKKQFNYLLLIKVNENICHGITEVLKRSNNISSDL